MSDLTQNEVLEELRAGVAAAHPELSVEVLISAAARAVRAQGYETARDILEGAALVDPDDASVWSLLGIAYEKLGAEGQAARAYERALSLDEDDPSTALALAVLHLRCGQRDAARTWLTWIVATFDDENSVVREAQRLRVELDLAAEGST